MQLGGDQLCIQHKHDRSTACYRCLRDSVLRTRQTVRSPDSPYEETETVEAPRSVDLALAYGEDRKVSIEINGALAWMFNGEIENILRAAMTDKDKMDALAYIEDDASDYEYWYRHEY